MSAKYYWFNQNNSGGSFDRDESVEKDVFIEAYSADEANSKAESIGIYFDGVDAGKDCECCGDRWSRTDERYGETEPRIWGKPISQVKADYFRDKIFIYRLDGSKEVVKLEGF